MNYKVTEKSMRPASEKRQCFYCQEPIDSFHKDSCVLIYKKILIQATIEYEIEVPAHWDLEDIYFSRNESSWCASSMIRELEDLSKKECLCGKVEFETVNDSDQHYLREE